jgi:hypothetical protein
MLMYLRSWFLGDLKPFWTKSSRNMKNYLVSLFQSLMFMPHLYLVIILNLMILLFVMRNKQKYSCPWLMQCRELYLWKELIFCATECLSDFHALSRIGHHERPNDVYKILRNSKKALIKIRTDMPNDSTFEFATSYWGYVYYPCQEDVPNDIPGSLGNFHLCLLLLLIQIYSLT